MSNNIDQDIMSERPFFVGVIVPERLREKVTMLEVCAWHLSTGKLVTLTPAHMGTISSHIPITGILANGAFAVLINGVKGRYETFQTKEHRVGKKMCYGFCTTTLDDSVEAFCAQVVPVTVEA